MAFLFFSCIPPRWVEFSFYWLAFSPVSGPYWDRTFFGLPAFFLKLCKGWHPFFFLKTKWGPFPIQRFSSFPQVTLSSGCCNPSEDRTLLHVLYCVLLNLWASLCFSKEPLILVLGFPLPHTKSWNSLILPTLRSSQANYVVPSLRPEFLTPDLEWLTFRAQKIFPPPPPFFLQPSLCS